MALGYLSRITASNQVRIGNSSTTSIGGKVEWTTISDGRVKKDMKQNVPGLLFINKLNPVTYKVDVEALKNILREDPIDTEENSNEPANSMHEGTRDEKENITYTGFV